MTIAGALGAFVAKSWQIFTKRPHNQLLNAPVQHRGLFAMLSDVTEGHRFLPFEIDPNEQRLYLVFIIYSTVSQ